jgi:hypothetical protein
VKQNTTLPVTDVCLGCICEAASECDRKIQCTGDTCGLFRITWAYWSDSGKPTLQGELPDSQNGNFNFIILYFNDNYDDNLNKNPGRCRR